MDARKRAIAEADKMQNMAEGGVDWRVMAISVNLANLGRVRKSTNDHPKKTIEMATSAELADRTKAELCRIPVERKVGEVTERKWYGKAVVTGLKIGGTIQAG